MTTPEVRAARRRRERRAAWVGFALALLYLVAKSIAQEFEPVHLVLVLYAGAWLVTEHQREWEAQR